MGNIKFSGTKNIAAKTNLSLRSTTPHYLSAVFSHLNATPSTSSHFNLPLSHSVPDPSFVGGLTSNVLLLFADSVVGHTWNSISLKTGLKLRTLVYRHQLPLYLPVDSHLIAIPSRMSPLLIPDSHNLRVQASRHRVAS